MKSNHVVRFCVFFVAFFCVCRQFKTTDTFETNLGFHLTREVSILSFNWTENSSDKGVDFWWTKTFVAASFS